MKVLLLNDSDIDGGAARAAHRLHLGLRQIDLDSQMLVRAKESDGPAIMGPASKPKKVISKLRPFLDSLPVRMYPARTGLVTPAIIPDCLAQQVNRLNPDIVHVHWVGNGFMRLESLARLKQPLVWTLHDMWAFTGGCHYDQGCGRYRERCGLCPVLGSRSSQDLARWIWNRKARIWPHLDVTIVTPSRWLSKCAAESSLLSGKRIETIPNGLDLRRYRPINKSLARRLLGLPEDKQLLLFGALASTSDPRKGFQHLQPALAELTRRGWSNKLELLVLGASRPSVPPNLSLPTHYLGRMADDISLVLTYSAADAFVAPSEQDNLPNTVLEAMACGTPCVAFDIGGISDLIESGTGGYLATPFSPADLASGIEHVLHANAGSMSQTVRQKIEREFDLELIARRHHRLYEQLRSRS